MLSPADIKVCLIITGDSDFSRMEANGSGPGLIKYGFGKKRTRTHFLILFVMISLISPRSDTHSLIDGLKRNGGVCT